MAADLGTYLGDMLLKCKVYGLATPPGEPPLMQAQLAVVADDAALGIPVLKGDQGDAGTAAEPFRWQFPSLGSTAELPTTYIAADKGKAFVINDGDGTADIAYWTGTEWKYMVNAFGPGIVGPAPTITVTGEVVDADDDFEVVQTGTDEAPHLHFKIPGTPGPQGPSGPWALYDDTETRSAGDIPVWDNTAGKFKPTPPLEASGIPRVRRYTQPESMFTAYSGSASSQLISTMPLPALDHAYQVDVSGHVRVGQNPFGTGQIAIVVRLGDATTGQIVAKGLAVAGGPCIIDAHYSSQASGQSSYASEPDGTLGRVAANSEAVLYVTAIRESGSGSWYANSVDAQLKALLIPAQV